MSKEYILERHDNPPLRIKCKNYSRIWKKLRGISIEKSELTSRTFLTADEAEELATVLLYFARELKNEDNSD